MIQYWVGRTMVIAGVCLGELQGSAPGVIIVFRETRPLAEWRGVSHKRWFCIVKEYG